MNVEPSILDSMDAAEFARFVATVKRDISIFRSRSSGSLADHPSVTKDNGLRRRTWLTAIEAVMALRRPVTIVETGVARDNLSTWLWAELVKLTGGHVHSVDIDPKLCEIVRSLLGEVAIDNKLSITCEDSISFIRGFDRPIDVLYLDSYDLDPANPRPSMQHHLSELQSTLPKLSDEAIVLVDDTPASSAWVSGWPIWQGDAAPRAPETPPGKGSLCIEFLETQTDYRVTTLAHDYQVVWRLDRLS